MAAMHQNETTAPLDAREDFLRLFTQVKPSPSRPGLAAEISSSQNAIGRLSVKPPSLFPAWASPTAALLDQPLIPE
jgi:hypothetical protein